MSPVLKKNLLPACILIKNELRDQCPAGLLKKKKEEKSGVLAEMLLCCTLKNERAKKNFKLKVLCKDVFEF